MSTDPNGLGQHEKGAKLDVGKVRFELVMSGFARALWEVAKVGTYGAEEYSDNGWMFVPNGIERYQDAGGRHRNKRQRGEKLDPDSKLRHRAHEAWNVLATLDLELREEENE